MRAHKHDPAHSYGDDKQQEVVLQVKNWAGESKDELYSTKTTLSTEGTTVKEFSLEVDTVADPNISPEEIVKGIKKPWMRRLELDDINVVETVDDPAANSGGAGVAIALDPVTSTTIHSIQGTGKVYLEEGTTKRRLLIPVTVSFNTQVDSEQLLGTWEISPPAGQAVEDTSTATFASGGKSMLFVVSTEGKYVIQARGVFSTQFVKKAPPEETKLKSMLSAASAASKRGVAGDRKENKAKSKGKNAKKAALAEE